jgi:hypothetical protein
MTNTSENSLYVPNNTFSKIWPFVFLVLTLTIPSLCDVQKFLGNKGLIFYLLIVPAAVFFLWKFLPFFITRISERQAFILMLMFWASVAGIFFLIHPIANVHIIGKGSDSNEGLNLAIRELLHMRYPYKVRAFLGNPISELPGEILLSIPFAIMGNSAYQNIFWIFIFSIFLRSYFGSWRLVLPLMLMIFIFSPTVDQQLVTGGPMLANEIFIMLSMYLFVTQMSDARHSELSKIGSALFLGIAMSSRLNFVLLAPPLISCLMQNSDRRKTVKYILFSGTVWLLVTMPFYFYAPESFTPFHTQASHASFNGLPFSVILLPLAGAILSIALAMRRMGVDCATLFESSALIQGFLIVTAIILSNMAKDEINFSLSRYGIMFILLGCVPCWLALTKEYSCNLITVDKK